MSRKIDMTGKVCNNWVVVEETIPPTTVTNKSRATWWLCKCLKCGRTKKFNGTDFRMKRIGECHCDYNYKRPKPSGNRIPGTAIINEIGNRYGKLTVESLAYTQDGLAYWNCLCDCGNKTIVRGNALRTGAIKSCGCVVSFKEQEIVQILKDESIDFQREYTFKDLVDQGYLRFDFAIFKDGILKGLIEYQGRQHFEPAGKFNHFGLLQKHDKLKEDYCKQHQLPLLTLDKDSNLKQDIIKWIGNL